VAESNKEERNVRRKKNRNGRKKLTNRIAKKKTSEGLKGEG
jgi:hypothetical protein